VPSDDHDKGVEMLKKWLGLALIPLTLISLGRAAIADGLDDPSSTLKQLKAPPPPLLEDAQALPGSEPKALSLEASPPKRNLWPLISQGMILEKPRPEGRITASEDQKELLSRGDVIYLSSFEEPFSEEQEWVVFKTMEDVNHPETGENLGALVYVLGMAKVIKVNDGGATARLTRSREPIMVGDKISFIDHFLPSRTEETYLPPEEGSSGVIVEVRDKRFSVAQNDIVYIDYGHEEGISEGDRFLIVHGGERRAFVGSSPSTEGLPKRDVGFMQVLATQEHTATAKIVRSIEPITKGDTILYQAGE